MGRFRVSGLVGFRGFRVSSFMSAVYGLAGFQVPGFEVSRVLGVGFKR